MLVDIRELVSTDICEPQKNSYFGVPAPVCSKSCNVSSNHYYFLFKNDTNFIEIFRVEAISNVIKYLHFVPTESPHCYFDDDVCHWEVNKPWQWIKYKTRKTGINNSIFRRCQNVLPLLSLVRFLFSFAS